MITLPTFLVVDHSSWQFVFLDVTGCAKAVAIWQSNGRVSQTSMYDLLAGRGSTGAVHAYSGWRVSLPIRSVHHFVPCGSEAYPSHCESHHAE
jgi:hypothetical protein